jgi:hypothetical protein
VAARGPGRSQAARARRVHFLAGCGKISLRAPGAATNHDPTRRGLRGRPRRLGAGPGGSRTFSNTPRCPPTLPRGGGPLRAARRSFVGSSVRPPRRMVAGPPHPRTATGAAGAGRRVGVRLPPSPRPRWTPATG